jgi:hypothetical protein
MYEKWAVNKSAFADRFNHFLAGCSFKYIGMVNLFTNSTGIDVAVIYLLG